MWNWNIDNSTYHELTGDRGEQDEKCLVVFVAMDSKHIFHNKKSTDNVMTAISRYSCMLFEAVKINAERYNWRNGNQETSTGKEYIMKVTTSQREAQ